jgi:hypothetical protein
MSTDVNDVWVPFLHADGASVTIKKGWVENELNDNLLAVALELGDAEAPVVKHVVVPNVMVMSCGNMDLATFSRTVGLPTAQFPLHMWPSASLLSTHPVLTTASLASGT